MDKVIIDGIDVSECKNFIPVYTEDTDIEINNCCTLTYTPCQFEKKDCYYKQLKRLQHYQAEFEHELMNDYTYDGYISPNGFTPIDVIKHIKSELKRLQAENERLKEEVKKIGSNFIKKGDYARDLEKELEKYKSKIGHLLSPLTDSDFQDKLQELEQENERLKEESDKLKQALRDIRECATTEMVEIATRKDYNGFLALQGISAKIKEVIGANR